MYEPSFLIALGFYFVFLGLITYWVAYQTVRVIQALQVAKTGYRRKRVPVTVRDMHVPAPVKSLPGESQVGRK